MKKITFFHLYNDYSGSPRVLSILISSLIKRGYEVNLVTSDTEGFLSNIDGATYHTYPFQWTPNKLITSLRLIIAQFCMLFIAFKLLKQTDLFYINTITPAAAAVVGKVFGKPTLYHVHEAYVNPNILHRFYHYVWSKCNTESIFVSRYVRDKYNKETSPVVYNALPTSFTQSAIKKKQISPIPYILMACSLKEYKGVTQFIQLAENLPNYNFHLVLNIEKEDSFLKQEFTPNLKVYHKQSEIVSFLKEADLMLNLSIPNLWVETFGLTILEAFTFGIPVICPPVGGPLELVSNGVEGFTVDARNIEETVQKITTILNPDQYTTFSTAAYNKSLCFSEEIMINSIIEHIHNTIDPLRK